MKRCPECGRDYNDDSMSFCLDDGSELLFGPAVSVPPAVAGGALSSADEPQTAILHSTAAPGEAPTRAQLHTTEQTAIFPGGAEAEPRESLGGLAEKQSFSANRAAKPLIATVVAVAVLVGGFFGYRYFSPIKQIESIAVMPFENKSGNADVEYLSDGMTETLINSLSQIPNLNVKARSTVFRYKGKEFDLKKIAAELNVQAILTGQVVQRGDQMTLNLELIDAKTENVLWGNKYERKASDLVSLQSEIARDVSSKLKSKLSNAEVASVEKTYTANSEAYQLYLQGRYHLNKRQIPELEKAVVFFKQAIEKDPNYALAYSGLADTYSVIPSRGDFRPKEYMPQSKQAALKALELDPNLAEAHTSLAQFIFYYEYDFAGAEKSYKKAIELNPNYAGAHQWYSLLLAQSGRHDEANREITKAIELDPFSFPINGVSYFQLIFAGRFDEALLQAKKRNELFPNEWEFRMFNTRVYAEQGKYDQAVEEYLLAAKAIKDFKPENITKLKEAYEKGGWDGYGRMHQEIRLEELNAKQAKDPNGYVKALDFASAYAWGKDKDKTIEYLNKAYDERERNLLELKVNRAWDFVRDDPRFKELVKRVGIPE